MNVEAVGVQKGKGKGPAFGTCWTCGGSHFARSCPKGNNKGQKGFGKGEDKGKGKGKLTSPMYGSCWTCGGNHFSRECPKGDGNGAKGGGKNSGKTMKCFNCGGFGHRAAQCPTSVREIEYDDEEEGHGDVESVSEGWDIFGLEEGRRQQRRHHQCGCSGQCQRPRPPQGDFQLHLKSRDPGVNQQTRRPGRWARDVGQKVTTRNRFEALQEEENEEEVDWIQWCAEDKVGQTSGKEEIVVDIGAAESVCPWDWASEFPIKEVAWNQKRNIRNASGGRMEHYGEKVCCEFAGLSTPVNMKFQVSDARNPLASVARITEHGNIVQFGPKEEDNYIFNPGIEEKAMMRRKGRNFVLDASFIRKGSTFRGQALPRVGNKGSQKAVRPDEEQKAIDELAGVENMEQDEEGEDVQLEEGELVTSKTSDEGNDEDGKDEVPQRVGKGEGVGRMRNIGGPRLPRRKEVVDHYLVPKLVSTLCEGPRERLGPQESRGEGPQDQGVQL